jgi:hypothetical protein
MEERPCCPGAAIRKITQLMIDGKLIGVSHVDEAVDEVRAEDLKNNIEIGEALLKKVKIYNYVPASATPCYLKALLEFYHSKRG